ncbi:MAG: hypothetical protein V7713_01180 [Marinobacter sp.]|uniref:hypothetical protein n=1 Tax=Marinobacter sp. AC-23 TaxID=1879031 RepID=UPI0008DC89D3|nr:hypothetical protein [Marinobacter sp. AC-23]OHY79133.1 hypothetical protein BCA33_04815 [Marinobacter sp. AC-23]
MKPVVMFMLACLLVLAGCQSMPDTNPANKQNNESMPASADGRDRSVVFISSQHCLSEYLSDQSRVHYGPCLKIISVDGNVPQVRDDGFLELPVATTATLGTSCVYRHADGSPIPATMETADFYVTPNTFTKPGQRWYLHAHRQARQVVGCEPTLSRSKSPTQATD